MDDFTTKARVWVNDYQAVGIAFISGIATIGITRRVYKTNFRRIRNSDYITPDIFAKKRWVKGVVTSVGDADNFRLYHTPAFGWRWPIKFRRIPSTSKELKDQTIHIRMAGVDAPEAAHFGRPAQPYSSEALAWLRNRILGKRVYCQLLRRDQYSRIVAIVTESPRLLPGSLYTGKDLSLAMIRDGWGTVYEQAGAEYGELGKRGYLAAEANAQAARRGMWINGVDVETPAEYKRRHASSDATNTKDPTSMASQLQPRKSWFKRWFF